MQNMSEINGNRK